MAKVHPNLLKKQTHLKQLEQAASGKGDYSNKFGFGGKTYPDDRQFTMRFWDSIDRAEAIQNRVSYYTTYLTNTIGNGLFKGLMVPLSYKEKKAVLTKFRNLTIIVMNERMDHMEEVFSAIFTEIEKEIKSE